MRGGVTLGLRFARANGRWRVARANHQHLVRAGGEQVVHHAQLLPSAVKHDHANQVAPIKLIILIQCRQRRPRHRNQCPSQGLRLLAAR